MLINSEYPLKIKCKVDYGISLKKDKIYNARDCGRGWFAFIDETNEEYAYPPRLFEVVGDEIENVLLIELPEKDFPKYKLAK